MHIYRGSPDSLAENGAPPGCRIHLIRLMQDLREELKKDPPTRLAICYPARYSAVVGSGFTGAQTLISGGSEAEFVDQLSDAAFDVVADRADGRGVETGGVVEVVPGFVAFAGEDGAGIAAAHGDHDIGGADRFVGPGFGELIGRSMPRSANSGDAAGLTSCPGSDPPDQATALSPGQRLKEPKGHLRPAGVMGAQEQDGGLAVVGPFPPLFAGQDAGLHQQLEMV